MIKKLLFFDSQDGTKNYDINATDSNVKYFHPYNLYFRLSNPITNINRIILKSVEMPIALFNIRNTGTMNLFTVTWTIGGFSGNNGDWRLTAGFYPTISNLLGSGGVGSAITNIVSASGRPCSMSITSITGNNGFTLAQLTHNATSFTINDSFFMNNILGFSSGTYNSSPIVGTTPINIFPDTHLYMFISNLQTNNNNSKPVTFKIPLGSYSSPPSYTHYEETNEQQQITISTSSFILDKLNIIVYDKFGYAITGYLDWSFSMFIEYDDNNTKQEYLQLEY
jgi:hypothetical protein